MKTSNKKPPVYQKCVDFSGVNFDQGLIITYGDTVYAKYPEKLPPDILAHEAVHIRQQTIDMDKNVWWDRFFADKEFRLSQEVEAYKTQIVWARENYSRPQRRTMYRDILKLMVNNYGDMCATEDEAAQILK